MTFTCLYQHVDVIRHDAPFDEAVPIPVEVEKRILHEGRDAGVAQVALTMPLVLVLFDKTTKRFCIIALF